MIKITTIPVKSWLSKSKIPGADYAINPYVGCPHKCLYCYAEYMRKFSGHTENWGDFLDVKIPQTPLPLAQLYHTRVLLSSVTDPYNPFEKKYELTRRALTELAAAQAYVTVLTKSALVLRDVDILTQLPACEVSFSFAAAEDELRLRLEPGASSIKEKIRALRMLHENNISTAVMIAPILPQLTDWKKIIDLTRPYTRAYRFDRLNMRPFLLKRILDFIEIYKPDLLGLYTEIFVQGKNDYYENLAREINAYCHQEKLDGEIFF